MDPHSRREQTSLALIYILYSFTLILLCGWSTCIYKHNHTHPSLLVNMQVAFSLASGRCGPNSPPNCLCLCSNFGWLNMR